MAATKEEEAGPQTRRVPRFDLTVDLEEGRRSLARGGLWSEEGSITVHEAAEAFRRHDPGLRRISEQIRRTLEAGRRC